MGQDNAVGPTSIEVSFFSSLLSVFYCVNLLVFWKYEIKLLNYISAPNPTISLNLLAIYCYGNLCFCNGAEKGNLSELAEKSIIRYNNVGIESAPKEKEDHVDAQRSRMNSRTYNNNNSTSNNDFICRAQNKQCSDALTRTTKQVSF